jgi:CDP-diacylglycerol--glycerol-3-phosphate 3-phosphatidyltransferase
MTSKRITTATKITILRIAMIPLFAVLILYYEAGARDGTPDDRLRLAAAAVFLLAAISDGVDGWIARRFNQKSELGALLDPIADKGLLVTAIILLSLESVEELWRFPLWFPILVFSRDLMLVAGYIVLHIQVGKVTVRPNWLGKTATVLQMITITAAMLQPPWLRFDLTILVTGLCTALSFVFYFRDGMRQLPTHSTPPNP